MLAYTIRRLFVAIPIMIVSSFVVFVLVSLTGDPLDNLRGRNPPTPHQVFVGERHRLWLDKSLPDRYWTWIKGVVLHGDFGPSVNNSGVTIRHQLFSAFFVTLRLIVAAMILAVIFAVIVGVVSAVRQYTVTDYVATFTGFLFLSMPVFWFAILLKELGIYLNRKLGTDFFATIGARSVLPTPGFWPTVRDIAGHMILPTIVLAMTSYAAWSRFQRAAMLEVLNSDYIRLARAKGLSSRRVMVRHALRNALIPLTTVTALDIGAIFGGAVITETVFNWQGMGRFLIEAIRNRDVFAVEAWLLLTAFIIIVFNLIADLLYAVLDPRIRYA